MVCGDSCDCTCHFPLQQQQPQVPPNTTTNHQHRQGLSAKEWGTAMYQFNNCPAQQSDRRHIASVTLKRHIHFTHHNLHCHRKPCSQLGRCKHRRHNIHLNHYATLEAQHQHQLNTFLCKQRMSSHSIQTTSMPSIEPHNPKTQPLLSQSIYSYPGHLLRWLLSSLPCLAHTDSVPVCAENAHKACKKHILTQ